MFSQKYEAISEVHKRLNIQQSITHKKVSLENCDTIWYSETA